MKIEFNRKKFAARLARALGQDKRKVAKALAAFDPAEIVYWVTPTQCYRPHAISHRGDCVSFSHNSGVRIGDAHDVPTVLPGSAAAQFGRPYSVLSDSARLDLRGPFMAALVASHPHGMLVSNEHPDILECRRMAYTPGSIQDRFVPGAAQLVHRPGW